MALVELRSRNVAPFLVLIAVVALAGTELPRQLLGIPGEPSGYFWPVLGLGVGIALSIRIRYWIWVGLFAMALNSPYFAPEAYQFSHPVAIGAAFLSHYAVALVLCLLLRRRYPEGLDLTRLNPDLRDFLIFAGVLALMTGALDPLFGYLAGKGPFDLHHWNHGFALDLMSIVVAAPVLLAWNTGIPHGRDLGESGAQFELALLVALLAVVLGLELYGPPTATRANFDFVWVVTMWAIFRFDLRILTLVALVATTYITMMLAVWPDAAAHVAEGWSEQTLVTTAYIALSVSVALMLNAVIAQARLRTTELAQATEYLDRLVQATGSFFWIYDVAEARFIHFSSLPTEQWTDDLDMRAANEDWLEFVHPADRDAVREYWTGMLAGRIDSQIDIAYRLVKESQETRWDHQIGIPIRNSDGAVERYVGMILDVTDQHSLQQQQERLQTIIHESDKLNSVGALATGLAHDWNNLLLVLSMEAERLSAQPGKEAWLEESIGILQQVVSDGRATTEQLLSLARRDTEKEVVTNLNAEVHRVTDLLSRVLPENISLLTDFEPEPELPVLCSVSHIQQIVMNLVLNARNAIGERGGTIRIEIAGPVAKKIDGETHSAAVLQVSDDGVGMTPEVAERIFEPLYSTRRASGGTGLGLSVVRAFVREMKGQIDVETAPGKGTTITVSVPVASQAE